MKIILIGANGIIGSQLLKKLRMNPDNEIITATRTTGDYRIYISNADQIKQLFTEVKTFDALICVAGNAHFGAFNETTEADLYLGIRHKMMGQINLVLIGKDFISDRGSFTLTSGFLSDDPIRGAVGFSIANGGVEGFVKGAAIELDRGIRINAVSPGNVESKEFYNTFSALNPGQLPVAMDKVVAAYEKSARGFRTGQIYRVWESSTQFVTQ